MDRDIIVTDKAPQAIGPYSIAIQTANLIFTSGQIGLDPSSQVLVPGGVQAETRQVLINLRNILIEAGSELDQVIKTTVFLKDMSDFPLMNAVYAEFFTNNPPARSTVAVSGLPKGAAVEIELIALKNEP